MRDNQITDGLYTKRTRDHATSSGGRSLRYVVCVVCYELCARLLWCELYEIKDFNKTKSHVLLFLQALGAAHPKQGCYLLCKAKCVQRSADLGLGCGEVSASAAAILGATGVDTTTSGKRKVYIWIYTSI